MRTLAFALVTALASTALIAACDDHGHGSEAYDTYQLCFDEHHTSESLPIKESIVICCLEHPIGATPAPVCGDTAATCATYLGANLATSSATPAEVTEGCAEYIAQKGM